MKIDWAHMTSCSYRDLWSTIGGLERITFMQSARSLSAQDRKRIVVMVEIGAEAHQETCRVLGDVSPMAGKCVTAAILQLQSEEKGAA